MGGWVAETLASNVDIAKITPLVSFRFVSPSAGTAQVAPARIVFVFVPI